MILESVEHGPLIWPTVEENGVSRTKKYAELSAAEKIQADCDMKATNIILQGIHADIYSLVNHHRVAQDMIYTDLLQQLINLHTTIPQLQQQLFVTITSDSLNFTQSNYSSPLSITLHHKNKAHQSIIDSPSHNISVQINHQPQLFTIFTRDDSDCCLNKAMAFLIAVASSKCFFGSPSQPLVLLEIGEIAKLAIYLEWGDSGEGGGCLTMGFCWVLQVTVLVAINDFGIWQDYPLKYKGQREGKAPMAVIRAKLEQMQSSKGLVGKKIVLNKTLAKECFPPVTKCEEIKEDFDQLDSADDTFVPTNLKQQRQKLSKI
ncbi:hypothetical protein Tco_1548433 [Tanacetum coccineum]